VTPCSLIGEYQRFGGTSFCHRHGQAGKGVNAVGYTGRLQGRSMGSRKVREPILGDWEQCTGKVRMWNTIQDALDLNQNAMASSDTSMSSHHSLVCHLFSAVCILCHTMYVS
jgi:hypothetical protein